ncbi:hypothetical protein [Paenibacillus sp. MER 99-2]|uniref:hypothetical protein n=1 Tax=Paenibacillus sp. MER 99-2 TaxID=2939572 RepID=UPI00203DEF6E|nr:hypothetical protein [Paenibacillus sp. MER 99-2]MCM3174544.1 hypothetical protein [Paenibacillus sp. MER 99-2]
MGQITDDGIMKMTSANQGDFELQDYFLYEIRITASSTTIKNAANSKISGFFFASSIISILLINKSIALKGNLDHFHRLVEKG